MQTFQVKPIGKIDINGGVYIDIDPQYIPALKALDGFSHLDILWWCSDFDNEEAREVLETEQPYKGAPDKMGIFATRSPIRPNPIALTTVQVIQIDFEEGRIQIAYIDANDRSPVLDVKPYTPSFDRVETPQVPDWCKHWPKSLEESADFPWEDEFNF